MKLPKLMLVAAMMSVSSYGVAEAPRGFIGAGMGIPSVAYGNSDVALKVFGGYQVAQFDISKAGKLDMSVQGEYVDFGDSSYAGNAWSQSAFAVSALGSWVIPRKWAPWADERVVVLAKLGGARVENSSSRGLSNTYTGLTEGVGAEYLVTRNFSARAMVEYYPGSYDIYGIAATLKF